MSSSQIDDIMTTDEEQDKAQVANRAAAVARFVVSFGLMIIGFILIGEGVGHQDSSGAFWFVGGILAVALAFALPLSAKD